MQKPTPEQALNVIENMRLQFAADGKSHDIIRHAVIVLDEFIKETRLAATKPNP